MTAPAPRPVAFGWFGDPWPSGVCYNGRRLKEEMRTPTPVGETCTLWRPRWQTPYGPARRRR